MVVTRVLNFSEEIQPGRHVIYEDYSPIRGTIKEITIVIPPGCGHYIQLKVAKSNVALVPQSGYIDFETNGPMTQKINEPVEGRERLWIEIFNRDTTNSHKPAVLIVLEGEEVGT